MDYTDSQIAVAGISETCREVLSSLIVAEEEAFSRDKMLEQLNDALADCKRLEALIRKQIAEVKRG